MKPRLRRFVLAAQHRKSDGDRAEVNEASHRRYEQIPLKTPSNSGGAAKGEPRVKINTTTPVETRRDLGEARHHQPGCNPCEEPSERTRIPDESRNHRGQAKDTAADHAIDG